MVKELFVIVKRSLQFEVRVMSRKIICDSCNQEVESIDQFEFRGHTNNDFHMDYWNAEICFNCQFKMRKSIGIHDKNKDLRFITKGDKGKP